jgi:hypothetical protein
MRAPAINANIDDGEILLLLLTPLPALGIVPIWIYMKVVRIY